MSGNDVKYTQKSEEISVLVRALNDAQVEKATLVELINSLVKQIDQEVESRKEAKRKKQRAQMDIFQYVVEPLKQEVADLKALMVDKDRLFTSDKRSR